jgi:hypothetical protein
MLIGSNLLLAGVVLAVSCGGSHARTRAARSDEPATASAPGNAAVKTSTSLVRLVDALPSVRAIDLTDDDHELVSDAAYRTISSFREMQGRRVTLRVRVAGTDRVLVSNPAVMENGYRYTIVAYPGDHGEARIQVLRDELVPNAGKARIRVINAAPELGMAAVALHGQRSSLFDNVATPVEARYRDIDPTLGSLEIRSDVKTRKPLQLRDQQFVAGRAYTVVLVGRGTGRIDAITFDDTVITAPMDLTWMARP